MTIPEIPPAHREAVIDAVDRAVFVNDGRSHSRIRADAAIATLLALGYRVAPGWNRADTCECVLDVIDMGGYELDTVTTDSIRMQFGLPTPPTNTNKGE